MRPVVSVGLRPGALDAAERLVLRSWIEQGWLGEAIDPTAAPKTTK